MSDAHTSIGDIIYICVKPIFKIYIIISLGFFLARRNVLTVDTSRNISALAITVLLPCLIFNYIVTNIQNSDIAQIGTIVLVAVTFMFMGGLCSLLIALVTGCPKNWLGGAMTIGLFPNLSDLPVAYIQSLETTGIFTTDQVSKGTAYICIFVVVELIFQFNLGGYMITGLDFRHAIKKAKKDQELKEMTSTSTDEEAVIGMHDITHNSSHSTQNELQPVTTNRSSEDAMSLISSIDDQNTNSNDETTTNPMDNKDNKKNKEDEHLAFLRQKEAEKQTRRKSSFASSTGAKRLKAINSITSNLSRHTTNNMEQEENDMHEMPSQTINDVVRVYSRFEDLAQGDEIRTENLGDLTIRTEQSRREHDSDAEDYDEDDDVELTFAQEFKQGLHKIRHMTFRSLLKGIRSFLYMVYQSALKPMSMSALIAIIVSMVPWLRALFVINDQVTLPSAPDGQPPLSFITDSVEYLGQAQVPIGLLMLGATISRIQVNKLPDGAWKTPVGLVVMKLCIFPIIGIAINSRLNTIGLFYDDIILHFVCNLDWCTPPATVLLYLTAFYTPKDAEHTLQMDYLALCYIISYILIVISLPLTMTYTMVNQLHL